jgi:hypothetical protein
MGNEAPPINPIEATVKEIKIKKEIEEKIQQDKKALADMQAPLVNYRPGMIVADNQAAFFTLPNYMGDVTILNVGRNNFQVGKINYIKYGKMYSQKGYEYIVINRARETENKQDENEIENYRSHEFLLNVIDNIMTKKKR